MAIWNFFFLFNKWDCGIQFCSVECSFESCSTNSIGGSFNEHASFGLDKVIQR